MDKDVMDNLSRNGLLWLHKMAHILIPAINVWACNVQPHRTSIIFRDCRLVEPRMRWGIECLSDGEMIDWAK